ncbi:MAG: hypothetical protein ACYDHE_04975 [Candidatus Acidiferrales bacterium]
MTSGDQNSPARLNEFQARRLSVTCQYIDKVVGEIEEILNSGGSKAAFPKLIQDVTSAQRRTIEDYLARIRAQLARVLDGQGIPRPEAWIPASRAVYTSLTVIDIAVEELRPRYMRGYGELPAELARELEGMRYVRALRNPSMIGLRFTVGCIGTGPYRCCSSSRDGIRRSLMATGRRQSGR